MRLGVGIGIGCKGEFAGFVIGDPVSLGRSLDAVGPGEPGVEPLGAVGGRHLVDQHVGEFVIEGLGVLAGGEVAVLEAPVAPTAGETVHDLANGTFRSRLDLAFLVANELAFQVIGAVGLAGSLRNACLAEVLAHHDVRGQLTPVSGDFGIVHLEDERAIGVGDARASARPFGRIKDVLARPREATGDLHGIRILGNCLFKAVRRLNPWSRASGERLGTRNRRDR